MKGYKALKYLFVFSLPAIAFISWHGSGWISFLPLLYAFGLIPVLELMIQPIDKNLDSLSEEILKKDTYYDYLLYLVIPVQYISLFYFLHFISLGGYTNPSLVGYIISMGILCGVMGINVAHELGHRKTQYEQLLSKALLLTSLYWHFFIEHNRGHHKNVSTDEDPASAYKGESLYRFWFRSIINSYISAWELENMRLVRNGHSRFSLKNEMLLFQIVQVLFILAIFLFFGFLAMVSFLLASLIGILLLETVNYIEHYGLRRNKDKEGIWERVMPHHSWNSDHILGRLLLFELSRHSDHHYNATRKYQLLRHHDNSPQMPTGYPGMMLLSLIPPLWFRVMDRRIDH